MRLDTAHTVGRNWRYRMIDDSRVERMAREYEMSLSLARKLLEEAREQPAAVIRRFRRYERMVRKYGKRNEM